MPQDWKNQATTMPSTYQVIRERGLSKNLEELDAYGLTVITPEQIGEPDLLEQCRAAVLRIAEERTGVKHDLETGAHGNLDIMASYQHQYLLVSILEKDPAFEKIIQHPMTLPLVEHYLGHTCLLSSLCAFIKWQDSEGYGENLGLHADDHLYQGTYLPDPPQCFNTNWILTDYTKANGAFCVVPGSHKLRRKPQPGEGVEDAVPIEAPAGSVLVFHGNVWHGAFPRENPGLRLSLSLFFGAFHYRLQENFQGRISDEMIARNGVRFRKLLNLEDIWGYSDTRGVFPWRERATEKTWSQIFEEPVTIHGQQYRIVKDPTTKDHLSLNYVPVEESP